MYLDPVYLGVDIYKGRNSYTIEALHWRANDTPVVERYRYVRIHNLTGGRDK